MLLVMFGFKNMYKNLKIIEIRLKVINILWEGVL